MTEGEPLRVHRIPLSTNVERVAIACRLKGVPVEWVDHDPADRSAIRALSGQDFVPVVEAGDALLVDSPKILLWLEATYPEPPLLPGSPARRAEVLAFCDWFNLVWKLAPNRLADEADPPPGLRRELAASADRFEALLDGRPYLMGEGLGLADVTVFPFLRIPAEGLAPGDEDPFHAVLAAGLDLGPRTRAWVARVASETS